MQVIATFDELEINRDPESKIKGTASFIVTKPKMFIEIKFFAHHQKQGLIGRCETFTPGQKILLPIESELYNGKVQHNITFGELPQPFFDKQTGEVDTDIPLRKAVSAQPKKAVA